MKLRSIRWKLSLTYAGIALITALVSGGTLVLILRGYYQQEELMYLKKNAGAISQAIAPLLGQQEPPPDLAPHLALFAFLSQTHVRLLGPDGQTISDQNFANGQAPAAVVSAASLPEAGPGQKVSLPAPDVLKATGGIMISRNLSDQERRVILNMQIIQPAGALTGTFLTGEGPGSMKIFYQQIPDQSQAGVSTDANGNVLVQPQPENSTTDTNGSIHVEPQPGQLQAGASIDAKGVSRVEPAQGKPLVSVFTAAGTMFGFDLQGKAGVGKVRSSQVFRQQILGSNGVQLGTLELSEGPAYGSEIVGGVVRGWALASLLALVLAVAAGWLASRRLTAPLLALTDVTRQMAGGDLSVRASGTGADELGELGRSFNEMACQVEEMVSTLKNFVADAAHELNTPLTALRTHLELAANGGAPEQQADYLSSAQTQVGRLSRLVRDLLDLSRLETGMAAGGRRRVDLAAFAPQVCEPYAAQAEQAGIELALELRLKQPGAALSVLADEKLLQRALGNRLENALKFTPAGGRVTLELAEQPGYACLRVADTGIGIPPEDRGRLLERFHRGRNAAAYPGSGLGLAIVKAIAQAHGGRISAESREAGACFSLYLPLEG